MHPSAVGPGTLPVFALIWGPWRFPFFPEPCAPDIRRPGARPACKGRSDFLPRRTREIEALPGRGLRRSIHSGGRPTAMGLCGSASPFGDIRRWRAELARSRFVAGDQARPQNRLAAARLRPMDLGRRARWPRRRPRPRGVDWRRPAPSLASGATTRVDKSSPAHRRRTTVFAWEMKVEGPYRTRALVGSTRTCRRNFAPPGPRREGRRPR